MGKHCNQPTDPLHLFLFSLLPIIISSATSIQVTSMANETTGNLWSVIKMTPPSNTVRKFFPVFPTVFPRCFPRRSQSIPSQNKETSTNPAIKPKDRIPSPKPGIPPYSLQPRHESEYPEYPLRLNTFRSKLILLLEEPKAADGTHASYLLPS